MKKILVLDVDETILNIEPLSFLKIFKKDYEEYIGKLIFNKYYLSPRPKLNEFIKEVKKHFELVAFSIVNREITLKKLKELDILDCFIKVYGKEDLQNGKKSLKKIADDLDINIKDIIAIDDTPESFLEKEEVIKIKPWFIGDSKDDDCLLTTFKTLKI